MRRLVVVGVVVACSIVAAPRARAAAYDFSAGSWIIPMDSCYQPSQPYNGTSYSGVNAASTVYGANSACPDGVQAGRDGILKAYGLVYRLLQANVPVYYILDTTKAAVDAPDLTIASTTATPVALVTHAGTLSSYGNTSEFMVSTHKSISYRGAPFVISAADVPTVLKLLETNSDFTGTDPRTARSWFQDVYIHQAKVNILQAPVRAILQQTPPKVALLDIGGAAIGVLQGYLKDAGLFSSTATASYPTVGDVFTQFTQVSDFTTSNGLAAGGFSILWAPHWEGDYTITTSQRDAVIQKITAFIDAGHPFVAQCAAVATLEGAAPVGTSYGIEPATSYGHLIINASGATVGLRTNQLGQPSFPTGGDAIEINRSATVNAWTDPLTQVGDYPLAINTSSWTFDWTPQPGHSYQPYIKSYVQSRNAQLQIETVGHKDGDSNKGLVIYLGGHAYGSQGSSCSGSCTTFAQYNFVGLERLVLNSLIFLGQVPTSSEQTRSAPVVFTDPKSGVQTTYLGTYVQQSAPSTAYPPWTGHFREFSQSALSGTNVAAFNTVPANWDASDKIKIQASSDSRTIFTAVPQSGKLTQIAFTTGNLTALQATVPALTTTEVTQIRQGMLGGVDHSIPAIIQPSGIAGLPTRPTVAYFGALDGMIHAVQVASNGAATGYSNGQELWAFIPPSQLAKTVAETGGVDGSPSVGDAFIVDPTGNGTSRAWRTLLAIPDGNYAGGTLDVIDVTDPLNPKYLWTASDTANVNGKSYVLGRAQGAAISPVMTTAGVKFAYFVVTDNTNGTWGNGFNLYALDAGDGTVLWRTNKTYANDTTHNDVPGTVAVIDDVGDGGPVDKVYFGDLEGKVWQVGAGDGASATAVFDAAATYLPATSVSYPIESGITLYRDPTNTHLSALGVTSGADWVPSTTLSRVFKIDLGATPTPVTTTLATLGAGERVYAVPTIAGNAAYFITSLGGLQSAIGNAFTATGNLIRVDFGSTPSVTTLATVKQGASEVAVDANGNVIAASATGITENGNAGVDKSQATLALQNLAARPVAVRAWLDLH
ncbi:MAG TPA: hypothetical protein VHB97_01610 [Polyangia bacterium]|nr:hypothetical protein [Polyangia bacterium]